MDTPRILIIDDEMAICDAAAQVLGADGYAVEVGTDGISGLQKVDDFSPDVVFVDLKMPGMSGMEVLEKIQEKDKYIVSVVITGYATIESAVDSMKKGAFDFLPKPFTSEELKIIARRALDKRRATLETDHLRREKEKMRQNFVSLVSHELRTPLVAVMQYLEVLNKGFAGTVSAEQNKIIERMKIRLEELLKLIDRWLRLSRIEELKLREGFEEFTIGPVIEEVAELLSSLAREKKVMISVKPITKEMAVIGDREMLKEVFTNLVSNGIKYNREGGAVTLESGEIDDYWVVDVSDTGVGIPEQELNNVGEEFYRIKREGSAAGSGLGLAIVKKILDIHDGRLEISSQENKGSTFRVYLAKRR